MTPFIFNIYNYVIAMELDINILLYSCTITVTAMVTAAVIEAVVAPVQVREKAMVIVKGVIMVSEEVWEWEWV